MKEIWKDIPDYENIYQASNLGRIRTNPNKTTYTTRHGIRHWKTRILKGRGNNYQTGARVNLWKNGKPKDFLVARLVAITFLGYPKDGETVNHKDGNRLNNNIENLEWLSLEDNIRHAFATGLMPYNKIRLYNNKIDLIFMSMAKASLYLKRNKGYISNCLCKKRKILDREKNEYFVEIIEE